jgi:hypothetical protein
MGLFDAFTAKNGKSAAMAGAWGAQQGMAAANGLFNNAQNEIRQGVSQADALFAPLGSTVERGMAGYNMYGDVSGANGADGLARAGELFRQVPGYSGGMTQGLDAIQRTAAARGKLNSGNTEQDMVRFASDYDAQRFGDFRAGLAPYLSAPNQQMALAGARAGLYTGQGTALANILGQMANNTRQGYQQTGAAMGDYYKANDQASANQIAGLGKLATLGGQIFGAFGGMPMGGGFGGGGMGLPMNGATGSLY